MYGGGYPASFQEFSNREDFFTDVALFDDDTGDALNLTGILALANTNGFTGSNWTVTDGAIATSSSTPFTVPGYPVGNQLQAMALTVGPGLNIQAGDAVTIADAIPANATLSGYVTSYTPSNGALVVQVGSTYQFEIRHEHQRPGGRADDYTQWWDWGGGPGGDAPLISASLGNGVMIVDLGVLEINIPEVMMRRLHHRSYIASMTSFDGSATRQVFIARLPILYGGVTN